MNSSGIKRGLAATAVGALAVTGLPFLASSASATPLSAQAGALTLVSPSADGVDLSAKNDGTNTTVRLEAIAPASVSSVTFQYSLNGTTFTTIGTATSDNGAFAYEWNPSAIAGATGVTIRATSGSGASLVNDDITGVDINNTLDTVNITDGEAIGVFQSPYTADAGADFVALDGTASDPASTPDVDFWDGTGFTGAPQAATSTSGPGATTGTWATVLDIDGYPFGANDQLLVNATDGTEDAEAFNLYKQTITTVTAEAEADNVPAGTQTNVTVTVVDQNGAPVAGARVLNSDNSQTETTDGNGEATFTQGAGSAFYYADATNAPGYNPELGDKQSSTVTVTQYNAAPAELVATSNDGAAFDIDEYDNADDITVQAKDQTGADIDVSDEQDLRYTWTYTPFGSTTSTTVPATGTDEETDETDGEFEVPFNYAGPGTYVLNASLEANAGGNNAVAASNVLTVKAGESDIEWTAGDPAQAPAGSDFEAEGELVLADGTGLPGRSVEVTYSGGTNANIVQADGSTAGARTVTTDADGSFAVTLRDPSADPQPEEDGTLSAATVAGTNDNDNPGAGPETLGVEFLNDLAPATVEITQTTDGDTPGELSEFEIEVRTADDPATTGTDESNPLTNTTVEVTLDHGYFTNGDPESPAAGADAGEFEVVGDDEGMTYEVTTDGSGVATVLTSIGRDEGFDDDGMVDATLTATAGDASDTFSDDWDSSDPLNGGEVMLEFSPESEQDAGNNLPQATPGSEVVLDVYTTDQFGNLVGDELVTISDNTNDAEIDADDADTGTPGLQVLSNFDDDGDLVAYSDEEDEQTITATWTTETYVYGAGPAFTPAAGPDETLTDQQEIVWQDVVITDESVTLEASPSNNVPVGTAVTETVTVLDEDGNPVPNAEVRFTKAGPGNSNDEVVRFTNNAGQAFYVFNSNEAGTAVITAVVQTSGAPVVKTDEVTFGKKPVGINLRLKGSNNGGKDDQLKAIAKPLAAGLVAKLFANGEKVAQHKLNGNGNWSFTVNDTNGKKKTKYVVKVAKTDETYKAKAKKTVR